MQRQQELKSREMRLVTGRDLRSAVPGTLCTPGWKVRAGGRHGGVCAVGPWGVCAVGPLPSTTQTPLAQTKPFVRRPKGAQPRATPWDVSGRFTVSILRYRGKRRERKAQAFGRSSPSSWRACAAHASFQSVQSFVKSDSLKMRCVF